MNINAITVLKKAIGGPVDIIDLMEEMKIMPWQIYAHIRTLRKQNYVVFENQQIRLREDMKAKALQNLACDLDIKKILVGSNEDIISYFTEPVSIDEIVEQSDHSRATIYRVIKNFKSVGIIKKVPRGYELLHNDNSLYYFAKWLKAERVDLEALR